MIPPDHPHIHGPSQRVLSDIHNNQQNIPSSPSKEQKEERPKGLHKKTKSSVSLRSLGRDKDKEKDQETKSPSKKSLRSKEGKESQGKPKKTKSSTNLAAIFSRPKSSSKEQRVSQAITRDKENTTPPTSAVATTHTPIWAELSSIRNPQELTTTTSIPLNDQRTYDEEIALYTPQDYSPSKQRNFGAAAVPTLGRRQQVRPLSLQLPKSASASAFMNTLSRKTSNERPSQITEESRQARSGYERSVSRGRDLARKSSAEELCERNAQPNSKVMAAVAALNGKTRDAVLEAKMDPKRVDEELEAVMVGSTYSSLSL